MAGNFALRDANPQTPRWIGIAPDGATARKAELSPEPQAEADALFLELKEQGDDLLREMASLLASKPEAQMLGQTEFDLRDLLHRFAAEALAAALEESRKKGALPQFHRRIGD